MGDWDYYCFLCAASFITYDLLPEADDNPTDEDDHDLVSLGDGNRDDEPHNDDEPKNNDRLVLRGPRVDGEVAGDDDGDDAGSYSGKNNEPSEDFDEDSEQPDESDEGPLDCNVITPESVGWLRRLRLLGENPKATGIRRCYISGTGEMALYGSADVTRGEDVNQPWDGSELNMDVNVYRDFEADTETGALSAHEECFQVLRKAFDRACNRPSISDSLLGDMNLDVLFKSLSSKRKKYLYSLTLDYGELDGVSEQQYFGIERGQEPFVCNPVNVLGLVSYTEYLPLLEKTDTRLHINLSESVQRSANDPFSRLSLELLTSLFLELPKGSILSAMNASRALYQVNNFNWFWRQRLAIDMPWLWEILELGQAINKSDQVDWKRIYVELSTAASGQSIDKVKFLGLANRRRIWNVCEQVLDLYFGSENETSWALSGVFSEIKKDAMCLYYARVGTAGSNETSCSTAFFPNNGDLLRSPGKLYIHWSGKMLSGMVVKIHGSETHFGITSPLHGTVDEVFMSAETWLKGFELYIAEVDDAHGEPRSAVVGVKVLKFNGPDSFSGEVFGDGKNDRRLLLPSPGSSIVGLKGETADGILTHFGLIEHPSGSAAYIGPGLSRSIQKHLWKGNIPPLELPHPPKAQLKFHEYKTGYWSTGKHFDLIPMEVLMFGTEQRELDTIVGFEGNPSCRGFAIHRENDYVERVGPFHDPQQTIYFPIDGRGGERIVGLVVIMGALATGIRLITNRGRQALYGHDQDNGSALYTAPIDHCLAGLYCSFPYRSGDHGARLTTLSAISAPGPSNEAVDFDALKDQMGRCWIPEPPPALWSPYGPIYGTDAQGLIAAFVNFSRLISKIDGLLPAPQWLDIIELGGFTITYADGEALVLGATSTFWPKETTDGMALSKMPQKVDMATSFGEKADWGEEAHVGSDEEALTQENCWVLDEGGEKLAAVSVWAKQFLNGIQFHTASGKKSPKWGKCGGEPTTKIEADGAQRIVGMKVILGRGRNGVYTPDMRPQAVQALSTT